MKSGVVIGLYLRALRICSPEYLDEEFERIIQAFKRLHYPEGLLLRLQKIAIRISEREPRERQQDTRPLLIIPNSPLTALLEKHFGQHLRIATPSQTKLGEMLTATRTHHAPELSVVYKIPCGDTTCDRAYIGQSSRGLQIRLKEHKRTFRKGDHQSPFLQHAWDTDHAPGWNKAEVIHKGIVSRNKRLFLESAMIRSVKNLNSGLRQRGDFNLSQISAAKISTLKTLGHG